jgi:hypothetical protein
MRSEPVAVRHAVPLENRFPHCAERGLHHPVTYRGNSPWALFFAAQLGNPPPPNRVSARSDWPFTSGCSPPRLATTQLPSVTKLR